MSEVESLPSVQNKTEQWVRVRAITVLIALCNKKDWLVNACDHSSHFWNMKLKMLSVHSYIP